MARDDVVEVEVALDAAVTPTSTPRRPGRGEAAWWGAGLALIVLGTLAAPAWSARSVAGIARWSDTAFTLADTTITWDAIPDLPDTASGYLVEVLLDDAPGRWTCEPDHLDRATIVCATEHEVRDIRLAWRTLIPAPEPR